MMLCKSSAWGSSVHGYLRAVLGGCGVVSQSPQAQAELWEQRGECCYKYRVLCVKPQGPTVYAHGVLRASTRLLLGDLAAHIWKRKANTAHGFGGAPAQAECWQWCGDVPVTCKTRPGAALGLALRSTCGCLGGAMPSRTQHSCSCAQCLSLGCQGRALPGGAMQAQQQLQDPLTPRA